MGGKFSKKKKPEPTPEEIAYALRITEEFEKAESGLVVVDGKLIEKPVLREMKRKLAFMNRGD